MFSLHAQGWPSLFPVAAGPNAFSLHAQGWPWYNDGTCVVASVLPARAGMARFDDASDPFCNCSPCTRRDGPPTGSRYRKQTAFSLHAQGWPYLGADVHSATAVLPARAGMARNRLSFQTFVQRSPCTRRDGPIPGYMNGNLLEFSLHAQGWPSPSPSPSGIVLPARAGMAHPRENDEAVEAGSPCTRRDGPFVAGLLMLLYSFSLHAQGWPSEVPASVTRYPVLPARAGMAPSASD